jgi:RecB family exonuclease
VLRPVVLLVPSAAAATELPRRLASRGRALAGVYALTLRDLLRSVAAPALLTSGLKPWDAGHDALLAARLLAGSHGLRIEPGLPGAPLAAALARTLSELRRAGVPPDAVSALAAQAPAGTEDGERQRAVATLYRRFHEELEGRFADTATLLRAARDGVADAAWLHDAEVLVAADLELTPLERAVLAALARVVVVRRLEAPRPPALSAGSFGAWAATHGIASAPLAETPLALLAPPPRPASLERIAGALFEAPTGSPVEDDGVELLTAAGEASEARAIVRRLLREAGRGVPFEEMGVILPRPMEYAALLTDLLARVGIPHRLHPSLPLRQGRCARSLRLLFRCRGLQRRAVMEFLTFAPVPFAELLGPEAEPKPARWDAISRDARIVAGLERWIIGLRAHAEAEREAAAREPEAQRRERRLTRARDAEALLRVVELLAGTLDGLAGEAPWAEWAERLAGVLDQWIGPERDRQAVAEVLADLASLGHVSASAAWAQVEQVVEARFEWERLPLDPVAGGAVHVGALDAMAGLPFRVVAVPGLVEGGFPGLFRQDPFLLDREREGLARELAPRPAPGARRRVQLELFDQPSPPAGEAAPGEPPVKTTQARLLEARRLFHRALSQATERLILSYPRADPRTGRERLPSLFLVAAASALAGRPLSAGELEARIVEDDVDSLELELAVDAVERDRARVRRGGREAAEAIAAGSGFFRQSHLAARARWSRELTPYDGLVAYSTRDPGTEGLAEQLRRQLDPVTATWPVSASRLATYSRCGFLYLLQYVLRLEPALEPEERRRLEPLERGDLFHKVAERFLRERRDRGVLPVRDDDVTRARLLELAEEALAGHVAGSPPRFTLLWDRERARFRDTLLAWLGREAAAAGKSTPAHFEVGFGPAPERAPGEPHLAEPLTLELGDGRTLRVSGKIDRIDRKADGTLVLRDYKTGRAPKDDGGLFRGGKQLQIPFYILAAARLFPDAPVSEAFLDFVDGGRRVGFEPAVAGSEDFRSLLGSLADALAQGLFVQEPSACEFCDYTGVCGPRPLLEIRRRFKRGDPNLQRYLRLRDVV